MIKYKKIKQEIDVVDKIRCDVCSEVFDPEKDEMEIQEFLTLRMRGGYGSIFGDGAEISCDICQKCLKDVFGKYLKVDNSDSF